MGRHAKGNIRERPDGLWEARLSVEGGKRKSWYGKTKREVERKLTAAKRERDLGGVVIYDERQTVGQYLVSWLDALRAGGMKARGWERYESDVRLHLIPAIGAVKLARLSPQHLQALYADRLDAGFSPASVAHIHTVIHSALDKAVRHEIVARNVASLVKAPPIDTPEMQVLSKEQVDQLLETARGDRLEALYLLAVRTGMRQGELLALRWQDIDLEHGRFLQVRHTLSHPHGAPWILGDPKTKKSRRRIDLAPTVVDALKAHRARQKVERLAGGPGWNAENFVFTRPDGEPLRATNMYTRQFKPLLQRAGLPDIRFHDLRHTCATLLLITGVNVKVVSELLGHSSVSITWDRYSHVSPGQQKDAAAALETLFTRR